MPNESMRLSPHDRAGWRIPYDSMSFCEIGIVANSGRFSTDLTTQHWSILVQRYTSLIHPNYTSFYVCRKRPNSRLVGGMPTYRYTCCRHPRICVQG
jgi:hypothetical protein